MALSLLAVIVAPSLVNALNSRASLLSVNQSHWDSFNSSVSGRLHNGVPILAPCYTTYNGEKQSPDSQQCNVLQQNRGDSLFVSNYFGGYQESNWGGCQTNGESCSFGIAMPDKVTPVTQPCSQGSVPWKYVDARSVEDIQKTLAFARDHNLRLVVKNTGHDYLGRSSAPDSFALWTHNIQPPIELTEQFVPDGCAEAVGDVVTFGAGQQFGGVYDFANARNYRVVGGTSPSVGPAGGWVAGGGHSMLSNELGLGVDNVQQFRVVLPNGTYITTNRCQNQDIFFALRGGGGGTFGVVTEMSTLVHPKKPMQFVRVSFDGLDQNTISEFLSIVVENSVKWASEGWGGYIQPAVAGNAVSALSMGTTILGFSEAQASMQPLIDLANRPAFTASGTLGNASVLTGDYYAILQDIIARENEQIEPSSAWSFSSRIVREESFVGHENQQKLVSILQGIVNAGQQQNTPTLSASGIVISAVAPYLYSQTMPKSDQAGGPGAASVTPAWRDGLWHVIFSREFSGTTTDPALIKSIWQETHEAMNPLRDFTPNAGAYQNEADPFEPNPISSFWGQENYDRLLEIKRQIDPTNLLTVHNGVGWDEADGRYSCYPDIQI